MKYSLFAFFILAFFACAHPEKTPDYKSATYDTSKIITVFYIVDTKNIKFYVAPAKRVIRHYFAQDGIDSVTYPGKLMVKVKPVTDSVYIVGTADSTLVIKDSTGKKAIGYRASFRNPIYASKAIVQETDIVTYKDMK